MSKGIAVNIGDMPPLSSIEIRWLITSSLVGRFAGFNASFEGQNPLGDPDLNLIKSVTTHSLIHTVWLSGPAGVNDGVADFLVDDANELIRSYPEVSPYLCPNLTAVQ